MKPATLSMFVFLAFAITELLSISDANSSETIAVTIVDLRSNPSTYFDKTVKVRGVATIRWENWNLWASEEAIKSRQCEKSVGIDSQTNLTEFNRVKVDIIGIFEPICVELRNNDPDTICFNTKHCSDVVIHIQEINTVDD